MRTERLLPHFLICAFILLLVPLSSISTLLLQRLDKLVEMSIAQKNRLTVPSLAIIYADYGFGSKFRPKFRRTCIYRKNLVLSLEGVNQVAFSHFCFSFYMLPNREP